MFLKTWTNGHFNKYYYNGSTAPVHDEVSIKYGDVDN